MMADSLLDVLTKGGHSRTLQELETVRRLLKKWVIYYWLLALVTRCYETMGVTRVTAELHSPEKPGRPGWGPWVEDNERKRVSQLPGSVRARRLSLSPDLGNVGIRMGLTTQKSAGAVYPNKKGSLAHWLGTELTKMIENVLFFITQ